jgi:S1-C subfamily serine protease
MPSENKSGWDIRQALVFIMGASFAVFVALFLWRLGIERRATEDKVAASAEMERRQTRLEQRLAKIEKSNEADKAALEESLRQLVEKKETTQSAITAKGSPFPVEKTMKAVVELVCIDNTDKETYYTGSGTVVDDTGVIVTNQHILRSDDGSLIKFCGVGFTTDIHNPPKMEFVAASRAIHKITDLAILQIIERLDGRPAPEEFPSISMDKTTESSKALSLGDAIYIGGYPGIGADTFTFTEGVVSGRVGTDLIKTSALIDSGTSGGAAFDAGGNYIGVPTAAVSGEIGGSLGYLISADIVDKFLIDYYANMNLLTDDSQE